MTSDHDALFRAICANPEDDTPRLVFADWLEENDEPTRAEFVRAQVEFARLMDDGSDSQAVWEFLKEQDYVSRPAAKWELIDTGIARRRALDSRIAELWQEHGLAWRAELPGHFGLSGMVWDTFHRGFPGRVLVSDFELLAESAERVKAVAPPVDLVCHGLTTDDAQRLIDAGLLPWVRGLELQKAHAAGLRVIGQHPAAAGIRRLVSHAEDGDRIAEVLATSVHWAGLRSLELPRTWCNHHSAETLFRAAHLRGLRRLCMEGGNWTADTIRAFVETGFPDLTDLRFIRSRLDDEAAEVLAQAPSLRAVRHLDLGHNDMTGRGATALLCSRHLGRVAFLGLDHNRAVRGLDRRALADAPAGGLRMLHCHGCRLMVSDVRSLVRSPRLHDLWYLDLDDNNLAPGAIREIVRGFNGHCPPVIWLTDNRIDDQAAVRLANWPAATGLRVLQLYSNPLTDFGIRTLLDSPHLKNLDGFGVSATSEAIRQAIEKRFGDHSLTKPAAPVSASGSPLA